jgi:tRNA modification GTPase
MNFLSQNSDTIIALSTAQGTGAIAVIRLSGKDSIPLVNKFFKGKNLENQASHTLHFGSLQVETDNNKIEIIDEVVVALFIAPKSFTGENVVEISCHGSPYIVQKIIQLFVDAGVRMARAGEFTLRAFLNGRMDLSQAEAVADLIASDSTASHRAAMNQMRGGFSLEIKKLRQDLIHFASMLELELDFAEEDVEFVNREQFKKLLNNLYKVITQLSDSFRLGNVLKKGVTTVIAGRPNAGKSTLLNALLNEERAIVSEIAGTTRDTIEETLTINGIAFRLIDTAGIREATDTIEAIGVKKTLEKVSEAAILLYVYDITQTTFEEAQNDVLQLITPTMDLIVLANKIDLKPDYQGFILPQVMNYPELFVSANQANTIETIKENLFTMVAGEYKADQTLVTNSRHYQALKRSSDAVLAVMNGLAQGLSNDFLAIDIRTALQELGEITGEITTEDLLGNIFSKFCIGK